MKKVVLTAVAVFATLSIYAQGTVDFKNEAASLIRNQLTFGDPVTSADGIRVALYWAPLSNPNSFTILVPNVQVGGPVPPVPGQFFGGTCTTGVETLPGTDARFIVKAWELVYGATFEAAVAAAPMNGRSALRAESPIFVLTTGSHFRTPPTPPADVQGTTMLPGFTGLMLTAQPSSTNINFPLISTNLSWRYLDDGSDQGTAWRGVGFSDATWRSGLAELGYGDGDEVTVIRRTNDFTGMTNITFYFRHELHVGNPGAYSNLVLSLRRDDGAVVYFNGIEVFRSNMTNGPAVPIRYTDFAGANTGSETAFNTTNLGSTVLTAGRNVIAVEVHQLNLVSSDVSFDLQLVGQRTSGPLLTIVRSGAAIRLFWFPNTAGFALQVAPSVSGPWTISPNQNNPQNVAPPGGRYFRLCSGCP